MATMGTAKYQGILRLAEKTIQDVGLLIKKLPASLSSSEIIDGLETVYIAVGEVNIAISTLVNSDKQNKYIELKNELNILGAELKKIASLKIH